MKSARKTIKPTERVLVVGIGNDMRWDDGAGLAVARAIRTLALPGVTVLEHNGEGLALMDVWMDVDRVIIVDAVASGAKPGTCRRFEAHRKRLPVALFKTSTHHIHIGEAVELARVLGRIPPVLILYGIEGADYKGGVGFTPAVRKAIPRTVQAIRKEIVHA